MPDCSPGRQADCNVGKDDGCLVYLRRKLQVETAKQTKQRNIWQVDPLSGRLLTWITVHNKSFSSIFTIVDSSCFYSGKDLAAPYVLCLGSSWLANAFWLIMWVTETWWEVTLLLYWPRDAEAQKSQDAKTMKEWKPSLVFFLYIQINLLMCPN